MKKAFYTIGLFSLLMVLTSFTKVPTVELNSSFFQYSESNKVIAIPETAKKVDEEFKTFDNNAVNSLENDPIKNGSAHPDPPKKVDE